MNDKNLFLYTFFGKVFPERVDVNIPSHSFSLNVMEANISGEIITNILNSQIVVNFITENKIDNLYTIKNYIEDSIRLQVDTLGYLLSCSYDIEITSVSIVHNGEVVVFGVNFDDDINRFRKERPKEFLDIMKIFSDKKADPLRRCLGDLREAIRNVKDVGFFCYRAIESLRLFFFNENTCKDKNESWDKLRKVLNIDRDSIDYVKRYADKTRHGDTSYISEEEYRKILDITYKIIDNFITYASNGYKSNL